MPNAVRRMTATPASAASALMRRVSSTPSMSGMTRSTTATRYGRPSACAARRRASPSALLATVSTSSPQVCRRRARIRQLVALSSTPSTRTAPGFASGPSARRPGPGRASRGTVKRNTLPLPGSLSKSISPPISSTSRLEIASPSPVPPWWDVVEDAEERLARGARRVCAIPLLGREVRLEEQPDHPDHAVHRGADLVAHGGDEGRLRPRSALGRAQRLLQRAGVQGVLDAEPLALAERADPHGLDDRADHRGGDEAACKAHHLAGGRERRHH